MNESSEEGRAGASWRGAATRSWGRSGLWRLLPAAGLLLLFAGNVRHLLGGHGDHDGGRTAFLSLFLALFVGAYGRPALFQPRAAMNAGQRLGRARSEHVAMRVVGIGAIAAAALFSQAGWLGLWTPVTRGDWELVAMDLAAIALYVMHFHAALTWGRETDDRRER